MVYFLALIKPTSQVREAIGIIEIEIGIGIGIEKRGTDQILLVLLHNSMKDSPPLEGWQAQPDGVVHTEGYLSHSHHPGATRHPSKGGEFLPLVPTLLRRNAYRDAPASHSA